MTTADLYCDIPGPPAEWDEGARTFDVVAWIDFLQYAVGDANMRLLFTADSGEKFLPAPRSKLDAMIDSLCGADKHNDGLMLKFIRWATKWHWGHCPDGVTLPEVEATDAN
jgi:hypothetical protein